MLNHAADVFGSTTDLILLGLCSGIVATTVSRSKITKKVKQYWVPKEPAILLGELISCPYCLAHWTSALFALPAIQGSGFGFFISWFLSTLVITGISTIFIGILMRLWLFQENEVEELKDALREMINQTKSGE